MNKKFKFGALIVLVLGTLVWIGTSAIKSSQSYYKTVAELKQMNERDRAKQLRVAGDVQKGSIERKKDAVDFVLVQDAQTLRVSYTGEDPLPDTFRDGAQALAEGRIGEDGVFRAQHIQAKCSSKYQSKPGQAPAGLKPVQKASL